MKRFALIAAAAGILAAPAAFAQSDVRLLTLADVIDHSAVVISPPVGGALLPLASFALPATVAVVPATIEAPVVSVAPLHSSTAVMGAPAATFSASPLIGGTAILDVPANAVSKPEFKAWMDWERSQVVRVLDL